MPLNDITIRNLKPAEKPKKYADTGGLYLYVSPAGSKSWRFDYRFDGKRQTLTFGTYPMLSHKEAREKLLEAKKTISSGINPVVQKKVTKEAERTDLLNSFEVVAREWVEIKKVNLKESYSSRILGRLELELFPYLASRPITEITAPELLEVLRKTESRGAVDTAHRCLQICGQIFRYAIATGRATHDISADLRGALKPAVHSHFTSLVKTSEIGGLLRAIDDYTGNPFVKAKSFRPRDFSLSLVNCLKTCISAQQTTIT
jgi:hypothetical protein